MNDQQKIQMLAGALMLNMGANILSIIEIRKFDRLQKQWLRSHHYMTKLSEGLVDIASNPKADPMDNRAAINKLLDDLNAEMLLEGVDFESTIKAFKSNE